MSTELDDMTAQERKDHPIFTGVLKYFPNALLEIAHVSKVGNDQHNPGEPLHWAMEKSTDEGDALVRHQLKAGTRDKDGERHSAKVAWRALAQLEREILAERAMAQGQEANWRYGIGEQKDQRTYPGDGYTAKGPLQVVGEPTIGYDPVHDRYFSVETGDTVPNPHALSDAMMGSTKITGPLTFYPQGVQLDKDDLKSAFTGKPVPPYDRADDDPNFWNK